MGKLSFFYNNQAVFKTSLKALKRRDYIIKEIDEENGIIRASKPKGILKTIVDTHSVIDKKQYLNGEPYKIKLDYSFLEFSYNKSLNYDLFLFIKPTEDINKKFLLQIYSENYFINELEFNIDFEFTKSFLISNKDSSYLIFACENKTYIMELKL